MGNIEGNIVGNVMEDIAANMEIKGGTKADIAGRADDRTAGDRGGSIEGKIGVFIFTGFQEMEFWYPVLRLREIGADVDVIGVEGGEAATSVLGYPVVPNVAMDKASPHAYVALIVPGGDVRALSGNASFRDFVSAASKHGTRIAAASQAAALVPNARIALTTDDVPQWTRQLLEELSHESR